MATGLLSLLLALPGAGITTAAAPAEFRPAAASQPAGGETSLGSVSVSIRVLPAPAPPPPAADELPVTGTAVHPATLAALGVALLLAGAALWRWAARRRRIATGSSPDTPA